ncbi:MAG: hypothetical protein WC162_01840 [Sphaerochaetaceae bacterium]
MKFFDRDYSVPEGFFPLDNASIIYPPTEAKYNTQVFRMSIDLNIPIDRVVLHEALMDLLERMPYFKVRLREGFFWYYLSPNKKTPTIFDDDVRPCTRISKQKELKNFLFRVCAGENRIAIDFYHCLTDGGGGQTFLLSLFVRYLELKKYEIKEVPGIIRCNEKIQPWETKDQFQSYFDRNLPPPDFVKKAYHYKGILADRAYFTSGSIEIEDIKRISRHFGYTITEFLAALLIKVFLETEGKEKKPVQISIPISLRKLTGKNTMRNFSMFVIVSINPRLGEYTFKEILSLVSLQIKLQTEKHEIKRFISRNVSGERNFVVKSVPNFLKKPFFKIVSDVLGETQYTTTISNIGLVNLPDEVSSLIERYDFFLTPNQKNPVSMAVSGINGKLFVNFSSYLKSDTLVEKKFFKYLVNWGVKVKIHSNRR